ncbi:MAG: hypothetical protein E6I93_03200 [Chloroflexi bacterium]|nr:MAG: hypothetical protein E6I93_03200 [Chloroflexota bacterium]TMF49814.1 MAG: hypothetical protein E6I32_05290 [Chloroflexota bacterium]
MIAQRIGTNNDVVTSDDATAQTVQAAVTLLSRRPTPISYRWVCETCGMIYRGSAPTSCESCGKEVSPVHQPDFHREMCSRW